MQVLINSCRSMLSRCTSPIPAKMLQFIIKCVYLSNEKTLHMSSCTKVLPTNLPVFTDFLNIYFVIIEVFLNPSSILQDLKRASEYRVLNIYTTNYLFMLYQLYILKSFSQQSQNRLFHFLEILSTQHYPVNAVNNNY